MHAMKFVRYIMDATPETPSSRGVPQPQWSTW